MPSIAHILFPFDFSAQGVQTAPFVKALASGLNARITLYTVMPPAFDSAPAGLGARSGDDPTEWQRQLQCRLDHALVDDFAGISVERVADLVIIGRRSLSAPFGGLRTHTAGIIQRAPCPVLSV